MPRNPKVILFSLSLFVIFSIFVFGRPAHAATTFPKPFPLTNYQKSDPEFSPYGVVVHRNQEQEDLMTNSEKDKVLRLLSEAGVKWARLIVPYFRWAEIQPQKYVWDWEKLDKEIQMIGNYGIEIQGTIMNPCPPDEPDPSSRWCKETRPSWWDGNDQDFKNFVRKLAERYSSPIGGERKIKYWMSLNEWNGIANYVPPQYFVRYMKIISQVLKNYSPDLQLSAPFSGTSLISEALGKRHAIDDTFSPPDSVGQYHDFLAFHKYANYEQMSDRNAPFIQALKAMAHIKFDHPEYEIQNKPVWVTEGGYGCNLTPTTACTSKGKSLQADDLQKRYWIALHPARYGIDNRLKIDKVFWFKDISANTGWETYEWGTSGLLNWDNNYEPRPAYYAYKAMALWYSPPEKVQLTSPAENAQITTNKPFFKWQAPGSFGSEGFRRYVIQIDNNQYFYSPLILESSNPWGFGYTTSTRYQTAVNIPLGTYFWRVKVEEQKGNFSSWSPSRKMTIGGNISPSPSPTPAPTPRIAQCNQTCLSAGFRCATGLKCIQLDPKLRGSDKCRNPNCPKKTDCTCPTPTPTPTVTPRPPSGWQPTPTPTLTPLSGDLDSNNIVDLKDLQIIKKDFGKTGTSGWIPADIDKNGKVDIFDYNILVENYGS